jgi:SAM-dependent methyltransferase
VPPQSPAPDSPAEAGARHGAAAAESARLEISYARRRAAAHDSWFDPSYRFMRQDRERRVLELLAREGLSTLAGRDILDVGCGVGNWLRDLVRWGATPVKVRGVDLLADRVETARTLVAPGVTVTCGDIAALDIPDASFDLVIQSTVFSSILDDDRRRRSAAEMRRVLRRGGLILWYDFHVNNPGNPDVRAVTRDEIPALFAGCSVRMQRLTLAPPLARAIAPHSRLLCELLSLVPFLRTHTLAAIRPA